MSDLVVRAESCLEVADLALLQADSVQVFKERMMRLNGSLYVCLSTNSHSGWSPRYQQTGDFSTDKYLYIGDGQPEICSLDITALTRNERRGLFARTSLIERALDEIEDVQIRKILSISQFVMENEFSGVNPADLMRMFDLASEQGIIETFAFRVLKLTDGSTARLSKYEDTSGMYLRTEFGAPLSIRMTSDGDSESVFLDKLPTGEVEIYRRPTDDTASLRAIADESQIIRDDNGETIGDINLHQVRAIVASLERSAGLRVLRDDLLLVIEGGMRSVSSLLETSEEY